MFKLIKWFWETSAVYTGYHGIKLVVLGIVPMFRYLAYCARDKHYENLTQYHTGAIVNQWKEVESGK